MILVKLIFSLLLLILPKSFRSTNYTFFYKLKNKIYSQWICQRFNFKECRFRYPINLIVNAHLIKIGTGTNFGKLCIITAWDKYLDQKYSPTIKIGENCNFGDFLNLSSINAIHIGNGVLAGRWVTIIDHNHGLNKNYNELEIPPYNRPLSSKGKIIIGNNVWIGDKVSILSGVTIGTGSIIGANTVITKDVPSFSIVIGPGQIIKPIK